MLQRWRSLPLHGRDAIVATIVLVGGLVATVTGVGEATELGPAVRRPEVAWIAVLLFAVPLAWRRTNPGPTLLAVLGATVASPVLGNDVGLDTVTVPLAVYGAIAYGTRRVAKALIPLTVIVWIAAYALLSWLAAARAFTADDVVSALVLVATSVGFGNAVRNGREAAERRVAEVAEEAAAAAATAERARIAREVHDVVAHHVSAMVIHAQAAEHLFDRRPDEARAALRQVAPTGREAVDAMRRLVRVLRGADGPAEGREPQPTLDDVGDLLTSFGRVGLRVELDRGPVPPLAADEQLSIYRVVQESLTNVLRHSGTRRAWVTLRSDGRSTVEVVVDDDGTGDPTDVREGHGLVGMHERAGMHGGSLRVLPSPRGGWRVHAVFRVGGTGTEAAA